MATDYEVAIQRFEAADLNYRQQEEYISSGQAISDIVKANYPPDNAQQQWGIIWERLKNALEERNASLKAAKDALRFAVVLTHTQQRGIDGESTTLTVGSFKVSSVTRRNLDAAKLFAFVNSKGKLQELLALNKPNKDGQLEPLVRQEFKFDVAGVASWLVSNGMQEVLQPNKDAGTGAYEETESTPSVKGPKVLGFLGEKKDAGPE